MEKHHIHIFSKQIDAQSFRRLQFAPLELTDEDDNCNTDTQYLMKLVSAYMDERSALVDVLETSLESEY